MPVSIYEYERQGPAPRAFFGQNRNYLVYFECQPSVQGLVWISPPKKALKNSKFSSSPSFSSARAVFCYFFTFKSKSFFFFRYQLRLYIATIFTQQCLE